MIVFLDAKLHHGVISIFFVPVLLILKQLKQLFNEGTINVKLVTHKVVLMHFVIHIYSREFDKQKEVFT